MPSDRGGGSVKSMPIPMHRSGSYTPSMLVNHHQLLSDQPQLYDCPRCKHHGETELKFVAGLFTWICFLVLLMASVFIFPLFFLWVPFFVGTFKDVEHRCENCKAWMGTYRRIGKRL